MALREIQPLDDKDWNTLIDDLEKGQKEEQTMFLKEALNHAKNLKISR